jgi:hypothetical protein
MEHASLVRIIFEDERIIIGGYNSRLLTTYKVFLLGHYCLRQILDACSKVKGGSESWR